MVCLEFLGWRKILKWIGFSYCEICGATIYAGRNIHTKWHKDNKMLIIFNGDKVLESGYYVYDGHDDGSENCFVANKAKLGLFLVKGSKAPDLGSCNHKIKWRADYVEF